MADKRPHWRKVLQQIVTFNLNRENPDPFWLMISRRLSKRKMEGTEKARGQEEGEPCTSTAAAEPALQMARVHRFRDTLQHKHRYTVLIGDKGERLEKMDLLDLECPVGDCYLNQIDFSTCISNFASGDDNVANILKKMQTSAGFDYQVLLSEGRFSQVYLVKEIDTPKQSVLKLTSRRRKIPSNEECSPSVSTVATKRSRMRFSYAPLSEEGQIHTNLKHKNILQMFGYMVEGDRLGIMMEWCQLGSIKDLLKRGHSGFFSETLSCKYFYQMTEAVEYLHQMGLIHQDITCHHFLVNQDDVVKLCDFAQTEANRDSDIDGSFEVGTRGYQPPEYLQGQPCNGRMFDLWGLGCCLYKMTTARLPFGVDGRKLFCSLSSGKPVKLEFPNLAINLSNNLKELLSGLLTIVPESRYSMVRLKNSLWLNTADSRVFIGNGHLVQKPTRTSSSALEEMWKAELEI